MYIHVCVQGRDTHLSRRALVLPGPPCWPCSQALQRRFWRSSIPEDRMKARSRQREPKCPSPRVHAACAGVVSARTESAYQSRMPSNVSSSAPSIFPAWGAEGLGRGGTENKGCGQRRGGAQDGRFTRGRSGKKDQVKQRGGFPWRL